MSGVALAYHITFGTYGTRLHGDPRGTVDRRHNAYGESVIGRREDWERVERERLNFPPVLLTAGERRFAEARIPGICERGGWRLHICAAPEDHVHVLLTASAEGKAIRRWLKTWLTQALSEHFPGAIPRGPPRTSTEAEPTWWAEGGSVKRVFDEAYFASAFQYIEAQRLTPRADASAAHLP